MINEVAIKTTDHLIKEFDNWHDAISDKSSLYNIAMYYDRDSNPTAIGFYIQRRPNNGEHDNTPYIKSSQTTEQIRHFFKLTVSLLSQSILPCTACHYTTMGFVIRSTRLQHVQQQHAEERAKRLAYEQKLYAESLAKQQQLQEASDNEKTYNQLLKEAQADIKQRKLGPLQAIKRIPLRRTKTTNRKVRFDWSNLLQDYEKLNNNIALLAQRMGCTQAAVRRQLEKHGIKSHKRATKVRNE